MQSLTPGYQSGATEISIVCDQAVLLKIIWTTGQASLAQKGQLAIFHLLPF